MRLPISRIAIGRVNTALGNFLLYPSFLLKSFSFFSRDSDLFLSVSFFFPGALFLFILRARMHYA